MTPGQGTPEERAYVLTLSRDGRGVAKIENVSYQTAQAAFPWMLSDHAANGHQDCRQVRSDAEENWDELDEQNQITYRGVTVDLYAHN